MSSEMLRFALVLALVVFSNGLPSKKHAGLRKFGSKIVGGEDTTINKRPYQVSMITTDATDTSYICGGSVLNKRWVLTAAHCLVGIVKITVRAGSSNYNSGGKTYDTTVYRIHPAYNPSTHDNDIGVVDLGRNTMTLDNDTVKATKLPSSTYSVADGTPVTVSGWGTTQEGGSVSNVLQEVEVNVVNMTTCNNAYKSITIRMICAGVPGGGKDSCQGDSGGPLVLSSDDTQVGVVSFGVGCARADYPGVYAKVASFRSWIKRTTGV